MLGIIENAEKKARKLDRLSSGSVELPPYPGNIFKTYRQLYPKYLTAPHLKPLADLFERAKRGDDFRACVSYPRRGGKTEMVKAGIVDRFLFDAAARICYASYGGKLAQKKSAEIRKLARASGVPIDPTTRSKQDWATGYETGGLWATSVGGAVTGMGFNLLVFDDMLEGREQAESLAERDKAWDFMIVDASPCLEPDGARILNGTRWHVDDPIGRAVNDGWEEVNVPAFDEFGNSYWAKRWSKEKLLKIQLELGGPDGYDWSSVYMGNPKAQGERIFNNTTWALEGLPPGPVRIGIGVDFAYTVAKSSDYSCAVVIAEVGGVYYVIDVYRERVPEGVFRAKVAALAELYQAQFVVGYVARTEAANVRLLQLDGVPAFPSWAQKDKKTHALPTAANWNIGRIKVLKGKSWERGFTKEVEEFTGADRRDDQVDALCTVFDAMFALGPIDWDFVDAVNAASPCAMPRINN